MHRKECREETPVSNGPLNERKRDQEKIDRENVLTVKENKVFAHDLMAL